MKKISFIAVIVLLVIIVNTFSNKLYADSLNTLAQTADNTSRPRWDDFYSLNTDMIQNPNILSDNILKLPLNTDDVNSDTPTPEKLKGGITTQTVNIKTVEIKKPVFTSQPVGLGAYDSIINEAAAKYGANSNIMRRIISCESGGNPNAYNRSGATGIAQFMPGTYYGVQRRAPELKQYGLTSAIGQIYALAFKLSRGEGSAWACYPRN